MAHVQRGGPPKVDERFTSYEEAEENVLTAKKNLCQKLTNIKQSI